MINNEMANNSEIFLKKKLTSVRVLDLQKTNTYQNF
jgi:hypothetical protein